MKTIDCEQGTPEWFAARLGIVTASSMEKIISPTGEASKQADGYANQLLAEMITGEPSDAWGGNSFTARGKEYEEEAAKYYAMTRGVDLETIGFCTTDDGRVGASPDRFVGSDGMLEIKTGLSSVVVEYLLSGKLEQKHRPQTQCGLYVTGRKWVDTMLYNPLMKPIVIRAVRNEVYIARMCEYLDAFNIKLEANKKVLMSLGYLDLPVAA